MPYTPGSNPDRQSRIAREASNQGHLDGPLPLISAGGAPVGASTGWANPHQVRRTGVDNITIADSSEFWLLRDTVNPGQQSTDLPPRAAARARDYSITAAFPRVLIGQDASGGSQNWNLPPALLGRPKFSTQLTDPGANETIYLPVAGAAAPPPGGQSTDLPTVRRRTAVDNLTVADPSEVWLFGTDAMIVGEQLSGNAPSGPRRLGDYSWTQGLIPTLIGQDALSPGQQLSGPAPAGPRRAPQLWEPGSNLTLYISQAPPVIPVGLSGAASELPPRGSQRARDYTFLRPTPLQLLGKDQLYGAPGQVPAYDWSYQRPKPRYQQGTGEPQQDLLNTLFVQVAAVLPPGQQVFDVPRGSARARDYTWLHSLPKHLLGQDAMAAGDQFTDLPPRGPMRLRDYSIYQGFTAGTRPQETIPPGDQYLELVPRPAARLRDYTWIQAMGATVQFVAPVIAASTLSVRTRSRTVSASARERGLNTEGRQRVIMAQQREDV